MLVKDATRLTIPPTRQKTTTLRLAALAILAGALTAPVAIATPADATPSLVADLVTGEIISQEDAARAWYPASLTKLMTTYVALKAVQEGRITLDTPFVVSARAARAAPSKMGFKPGTEITLDNALKILMVKSANDVAITVAEGVSGSVEDFADLMNRVAAQLGMSQSHFVNPNGLFDPAHVSSARDMAILARALYMDFPQQSDLYSIGALRLDGKIIPTHNGLIGRYPGADGMKTGFVCASGFNVVASAQRGGRHLVVVVMGSPNAKLRTVKAAGLLDSGFAGSAPWRARTLATLPAIPGPPPNMRAEVCGKHRKVVQEDDLAVIPSGPGAADDSAAAFFANDGRAPVGRQFLSGPLPVFEPIDIFVGRRPGWTGPVMQARAPRPADAVPDGATAFADPTRKVPPGVPSVADSALPLGLSGAARGIGATATRAIAVKSRAEAREKSRQAHSAKIAAKTPQKNASKAEHAAEKSGTTPKARAKQTAKPGVKPAAKASAKSAAVKVSDRKAKTKTE